jgi:hypothetical protein
VLIAFIFTHLACALSESSISASNNAMEMLIAGDGFSVMNLPACEPSVSYGYLNELNGKSNKDEIGYRIASSELALGLDSKLDRLGANEVKSNHSNASFHLGSYSVANFDRLLLGSEESKTISDNNPLIACSYPASDTNSKLDSLCAEETDSNKEESNLWISSSSLGSDAGANLDRLLSERGAFEDLTGNDPSIANDHEKSRDENFNLINDIYITSYTPSDQIYLYSESFDSSGVAIAASIPIISHDISPENCTKLENISYRYENVAVVYEKSTKVVHDIDLSLGYIKTDSAKKDLIDDHHFNSDLNLGRLDQLATSSGGIGRVERYDHPEVNQNLDVLIENGRSDDEHIVPYLFGRWDAEEEPDDEKGEYPKNYAVVVGINSYMDWNGLNSPVNDAREISEILEACGYEVLELTDETEMKPTKENILRAALDDIKTKQDDGNIIFYFSGHGVRGEDGTFYLVPQDAKSNDLSSCISELELRGYLRDLDNLAVIIDACNSGDLEIADEGQLVLTSSKKDEPSNEEWFGSLSVFTYNLCKAIEEEMLSNRNISLSKCFYRARNDTVRWSSWRLVSQTPEIIDFTGGNYYIK